MNEILVKLYVPTIDEQYDIWIPLNKKIYVIIELLAKAVKEFSKGYYDPTKMPYLYDRKTAVMYDINLTVIESGIKNGAELIMI